MESREKGPAHFLQRALAGRAARLGAVLVVTVMGIAVLGPYFAPYRPSAIVARAYATPSDSGLFLGSDYLGRDALSRFLWGGRSLLVVTVGSIALAYSVGVTLGLLAAWKRGYIDLVMTGLLDVTLAFPPLVFVLVLLSTLGTRLWLVSVGVATIFAPRIARLVRGTALEVSVQEFVEAAVARGERTWAILFREILPNLWPPLLADLGIRFTWAVLLIASLGFLGFGQQPPAADWGLLISENRSGLFTQPWAVLAPASALAMLTVGINLVADGIVGALGRSDLVEHNRI